MEVIGNNLAAAWWGYSVSDSLITGLVVAMVAVFAIVYVGLRVSGKSPGSLAWKYLAYFGATVAVVVGLGFVIGMDSMMIFDERLRPELLQALKRG